MPIARKKSFRSLALNVCRINLIPKKIFWFNFGNRIESQLTLHFVLVLNGSIKIELKIVWKQIHEIKEFCEVQWIQCLPSVALHKAVKVRQIIKTIDFISLVLVGHSITHNLNLTSVKISKLLLPKRRRLSDLNGLDWMNCSSNSMEISRPISNLN